MLNSLSVYLRTISLGLLAAALIDPITRGAFVLTPTSSWAVAIALVTFVLSLSI